MGLPGTTLNLTIDSASQISSTFSGTCTGVPNGQPVYLGSLSTSGTLKVSASLAFSALGVSKTLPLPSEISVPIPPTTQTIVMTANGAPGPASCGSGPSGDGGGSQPDGGTPEGGTEGRTDTGAGSSDAPVSTRDAVSTSDAPSDTRSDAPLACPPQSTTSYTAPTYVDAVANQNLCTATDIAAFVGACGDNSTTTSCDDWAATNVAGGEMDGGGTGTPCGNCILSPMNNGALWLDGQGGYSPNYAACIQLLDPSMGPACASAYDDALGCYGLACDAACPASDTSAADYDACIDAAESGSCASYATAEKSACAKDTADGGVASTCMPGAATNTISPDFTYIATLICGQ